MRLVHKDSRKPVEKGEVLTDFRGDRAIFDHHVEPVHSGSTGRAYVMELDDNGDPIRDSSFGYYPSVFDLEWEQD
jgi:hypothetical protein